jgi:DNA-binding NtrC family response regulator
MSAAGPDGHDPACVRRGPAPDPEDFVRLNLIGDSPAFLAVLRMIRRLSACDAAVLICGETGTGKELAARAIHYLGSRRNAPFIPVNCGAIPDNLFESEFFGHMRGAFTDAKESRSGVIEQAEGGTLFLDELEALSPRGQVALLRFLQDHMYRPVGAALVRTADVRVIGSTNADLGAMAKQGVYRLDLLFRLSVLVLDLPPLRARPGDAALLADRFVRRLGAEYQLTPPPLSAVARAYLDQHDWPGNVRELENLVHRALLLNEGPELSFGDAGEVAARGSAPIDPSFSEAKARAIAHFERTYVTELLRRTRGNISLAARLSGKERSRLGKLVKKYGLRRVAFAAGPEEA